MTTFPKSIEAPIERFFHTPVSWDKGVRNGGMTAVIKHPDANWNDVLVYQPDSPGENWWDLVPRHAVIRASIREPAKKNPKDLIAFALPLKNQPSATQELIKSLQSEEITEETEPGLTDGDKLEEQIQEDIKRKQDRQIQLAQSKRLQRLALMGEWLESNEKALVMAQGMICNAFFEWCEDSSEEADTKCLHEMMDAIHYIIEIGGKLRSNCWCPDKEYDGALYYHGHDGQPVKVIDLNELP